MAWPAHRCLAFDIGHARNPRRGAGSDTHGQAIEVVAVGAYRQAVDLPSDITSGFDDELTLADRLVFFVGGQARTPFARGDCPLYMGCYRRLGLVFLCP